VVRIDSLLPNSGKEISWKFTAAVMCKEDPPQCAEFADHSGKSANTTNSETEYHKKFEKVCRTGEVLVSIYSEHSAKEEDRTFSFSCGAAVGVNLTDCAWTKEDSKLLGSEWIIGTDDRVIVGLRSAERDADRKNRKDRTFSIKSCRIAGLHMHESVIDQKWANEYGRKLSYTVQSTSFMTKIISHHSNSIGDRIFKFSTIRLCRAGADWVTPHRPAINISTNNLAVWSHTSYSAENNIRHMKDDLNHSEIPWTSFSDFEEWGFNSKALLIPEQTKQQLLLTLENEDKMQNYVVAGGTLIVCEGGVSESEEHPYRGLYLLKRIFGFQIEKFDDSDQFYNSLATASRNDTGCGIFCTVKELKDIPWTTKAVLKNSLPNQALVAFYFEDGKNKATTPVFTIPYKKGLIVYFGFNWYEGSQTKRQPWPALLKLAYSRGA